MPNNIYPDNSNSQFDIRYAKRLVLISDVLTGSIDVGTPGTSAPGDITDPGTPSSYPTGDIPNDQEFTANYLETNENNFLHNSDIAYLTYFKNLGIKLWRNNLPQVETVDFTWNSALNKLSLSIPIVYEENFKIQGYRITIPPPEDYTVVNGGGNINNIEDGNNIIFLTTFTNVRIRVYRNNIIQSALTEFTWDAALAKLTLTIAPVVGEEFHIEGY